MFLKKKKKEMSIHILHEIKTKNIINHITTCHTCGSQCWGWPSELEQKLQMHEFQSLYQSWSLLPPRGHDWNYTDHKDQQKRFVFTVFSRQIWKKKHFRSYSHSKLQHMTANTYLCLMWVFASFELKKNH